MSSEKFPNTAILIREIQKLARLADELSSSARDMGAELEQLQQILDIKQHFDRPAYPAGSNKPN